MQSVRIGIEFINKYRTVFYWFNAIHFAGMNAVKVQRMRMSGFVIKNDADTIALSCPQCWPRHAIVHVPGVESDGAVKLDDRSISFQAKFAYRAPVFARHRAVIKIPRNLHRVDIADGDCIGGHWRYSRHSRSFLGQILQCDRAARYPSTSYS